jgi:hypothetical protein
MSLTDKLARIRAMIEEYNTAINDTVFIVKADEVISNLQKMGMATEAVATQVTWEDLQQAGLPKLLARQAAQILREKPDGQPEPTYVSGKKADRMTFEELFGAYKAEVGHEDNVTKKLRELSGGKPCVVFSDDKTVNVVESVKLLKDIKRGLPDMTMVVVDGVPRQVYKVGEVSDVEFDQNPLYPNRVLRTDEVCDQTHRSWKGIPLEVRQLVLLGTTKTQEARMNTLADAHDLLDMALRDGALRQLRNRMPRAELLLRELAKNGQAPRLKLKAGTKGNDPFKV